MRRLVRIDKLITRMGVSPSIYAQNPTLLSALDAAQLRIQSELESLFETTALVDQFYLDSSYQGAMVNGRWQLRLSSGLVRGSPALTCTQSRAWNSTGSDVIAVADTDFALNAEKGLIRLDPSVVDGQFVSVGYSVGYDNDDEVPEWLQDAIMGYVPLVMNFSQVADRPANLKDLQTLNVQHALAVLVPHLRGSGGLMPV